MAAVRIILCSFKKFPEFAGIIYRNCYCTRRNAH